MEICLRKLARYQRSEISCTWTTFSHYDTLTTGDFEPQKAYGPTPPLQTLYKFVHFFYSSVKIRWLCMNPREVKSN
jgi:hypothetical protein